MITGTVTADLEATIRLKLRVSVTNGQEQEIEAVVDTGFNGFLTLPSALISSFGLPTRGSRQATLADGQTVRLDVYRATIIWDGQPRDVLVLAAEGGPLVGMSLLQGFRLTVDVADGGSVTIEALP
jgi:clan AA aspartic protease